MKKLTGYICIAALAVVFMASCKPHSLLQRDIRHLEIRFKPLTRNDITLVGNLSAEVTVSGKGIKLDKSFRRNQKLGRNYKERTDILYFAPNPGEVITGSLYDGDIFEFARTSTVNGPQKRSLFQSLFPGLARSIQESQAAGPADFAFYALIEKYPDVDYFINVRLDRKHILSGTSSRFTETIIIRADGVKLKTD
jgi:hypothetical protein